MKITLSMKIDETLKIFEDEFDIVLKINKPYRDDTTFLEISTVENKNISLNITKDTKISALENMFLNHFGISVKAKDINMDSINSDIRLGDVRELHTAKIKDDNINSSKKEDDKANAQIEVSDKKINKNQASSDKNKYTLVNKSNEKIEDIISKIDRSYMLFQENEKYKSMARLLSTIEDVALSYPNNTELERHILDIRTKGFAISNIALKKRKFSLIIFSIISLIILSVGIGVLCFDIYYHFKSIRKIENISREINSLNSSKLKASQNNNNEESTAIDKIIEDSNKEIGDIEKKLNKNKINIFLVVGIIFTITSSILLVKVEKYSIMSTRFYK